MSPEPPAHPAPIAALRALALALPDVTEGVSCAGTSIEKMAFQSRKKTFLHLGTSRGMMSAMLKLRAHLGEASALATARPDRYKVGSSAWVTATLPLDEPLPEHFDAWLRESYQLQVEKR